MGPESVLEILLPFHGRVDHFREAVESVLAQRSGDWRLVVVDDASPEDVSDWLAGIDDPRISYYRNPVNLGFAANFQRCLELASADHVVFLGCDDRMLSSYVDVVGRAVRESGATMVQPGVAVIDDAGRRQRPLGDRVKARLRGRLPHGRPLTGEPVATSLMHGAWTYFPSICWQRAALVARGFDPTHGLALDVAMIVALLRDGGSLLLLEEELFEYRRHDDSASMTAAHESSRFAEERRFFARMATSLDDQSWPRAARAARLHLTSRLHAATMLPRAARSHRQAVPQLLRHITSYGAQ